MFRLADYCAKGEHCSGELLAQMAKWEIPEEARMRIMKELQKRRYFDDERYTQAFVNDKIRYTKWGRRKIEQALWQKHISQHISQQVLDAVDDADYVEVLKPLLRQRSRTIFRLYQRVYENIAGKPSPSAYYRARSQTPGLCSFSLLRIYWKSRQHLREFLGFSFVPTDTGQKKASTGLLLLPALYP